MPDTGLLDRPSRGPFSDVTRSEQGMVVQVDRTRVRLNATAFALWELCDGETFVSEMVKVVCELFDVGPERASEEVTATIDRMREAGLVT